MIDDFKIKLDEWCKLKGFSSVDWITDVAPYNVPPQVPVVLCIENHELFNILNGYSDDYGMALYNEFESLMKGCGVWWEQQDSCIVWIFNEDTFDEEPDGIF